MFLCYDYYGVSFYSFLHIFDAGEKNRLQNIDQSGQNIRHLMSMELDRYGMIGWSS